MVEEAWLGGMLTDRAEIVIDKQIKGNGILILDLRSKVHKAKLGHV